MPCIPLAFECSLHALTRSAARRWYAWCKYRRCRVVLSPSSACFTRCTRSRAARRRWYAWCKYRRCHVVLSPSSARFTRSCAARRAVSMHVVSTEDAVYYSRLRGLASRAHVQRGAPFVCMSRIPRMPCSTLAFKCLLHALACSRGALCGCTSRVPRMACIPLAFKCSLHALTRSAACCWYACREYRGCREVLSPSNARFTRSGAARRVVGMLCASSAQVQCGT
jgi:hypothetical protein